MSACCRICLDESRPLIRPCRCADPVHAACLDQWRDVSAAPAARTRCAVCDHTLDTRVALDADALRRGSRAVARSCVRAVRAAATQEYLSRALPGFVVAACVAVAVDPSVAATLFADEIKLFAGVAVVVCTLEILSALPNALTRVVGAPATDRP